MSTSLGGSKTSPAFSELILQFSALSFCSLERGKKKRTKKGEKLLSARLALQLTVSGAALCYKKLI
jgi:hypothetical protein